MEPEPASSEVMVPQNLVPDFIGMDYTQVQNNREYTSMYLFYVTEEYSDTAPAGQIIQQQPDADTVLKAGETIRLVVSKGPQMVEIPNIIGFTQDGAVKELEARGLVASCFMVVNDGSYASGCVVRTSEEPGTRVAVSYTHLLWKAGRTALLPASSAANGALGIRWRQMCIRDRATCV